MVRFLDPVYREKGTDQKDTNPKGADPKGADAKATVLVPFRCVTQERIGKIDPLF